MNQYNLRPLWDAILDVYKEVAALCDREGIRYFVGCGSALGAVRHKGFIPWDDDMDLVMTLPEYKRFLKVAETGLPPHLALVTSENTPGFNYNFVKVSDLRREKVLSVSAASGHPMAGGINIDIFPLSTVPSTTVFRRIRSTMLRLRQGYVLGEEFPTLKAKVGRVLGFLLGCVMPGCSSASDLKDICERAQTEMSKDKAKLMGWYDASRCAHVECAPVECFDSVSMMPFEGMDVPVPGDYDAYLKGLYGEYMTPVKPLTGELSHGRVRPQAWRFGPTKKRSDK